MGLELRLGTMLEMERVREDVKEDLRENDAARREARTFVS